MTFFGISGDALSLPTQMVAFTVAFTLGVCGWPKALLLPLIGLGLVANIVAQIIFAGGGPGACAGFVGFPVICLILGYSGRGIWWVAIRRKIPAPPCEGCGMAITDELTAECPACARRLRCKCGYSLAGNVSGVCPECGAPV